MVTPEATLPLRTVGRVTTVGSASAWGESPLQLLCAVEYAALAGIPLRIVPRAGAVQLAATAQRLEQLGLPVGVEITAPRAVPAISGAHAVIGDAFSGRVQSAMAVRMPRRVTIVDDGSMSLRLPSVLESGRPLSRSGSASTLARLTGSRLRALDALGDLELFSYYRLGHPAWVPNRFAWLSSRSTTGVAGGAVVLGAAAVADGLIAPAVYLDWVARQPAGARYFPHRRESAEQLAAVARLGLTVVQTGLPIELVLAGSQGLSVSTLASSAADTLRILLADTGSRILVDDRMAVAA